LFRGRKSTISRSIWWIVKEFGFAMNDQFNWWFFSEIEIGN
jgi:hypothetical protein